MMDLVVKINGGVQESNFDSFRDQMLLEIEKANIPLVNDEDFAFAERAVKTFKEAEDAISVAKENALRETADIAKVFDGLDLLANKLRSVRLEMNKKVNTEKKRRKDDIVDSGYGIISRAIGGVAETLPEIQNAIRADRLIFEEAIAGKRSIEKMEEAVESLVESEKNKIEELSALILKNKCLIEECDFPTLFPDAAEVVCKPCSEVKSLIDGRVAKHKLAEKERKEREEAAAKAKREREEAEEKAKANLEREKAAELVQKEPAGRSAQEEKKIELEQPAEQPKPEQQPELEKKEEPTGDFVLTMNLYCSVPEARSIASKVNELFGGYGEVVKIGLSRV